MRYRSLIACFALLMILAGMACPPRAMAGSPLGAEPQSPLGVNLDSLEDWSDDLVLLDFFKMSREWIPQCVVGTDAGCTAKNAWDTEEYDLISVDSRGWVRSLPKSSDAPIFTSISTLIMLGDPRLDFSGDYVVLYEGEGTITYPLGAAIVDSKPGRDVIRIGHDGYVQIKISATDPRNTGNYLRNFHVVPIAYETTYKTQIFDPRFLDRLGPVQVLRFMDWMRTNTANPSKWANRAVVNDARYTTDKGVPLEIMTALANRISKDPWFNMPHTATNEYMNLFAAKAKQLLSPNVDVYVEFSNEVWNSRFPQYGYAMEKGVKLFGDDDVFQSGMNWHGMRTAQMCDIWKAAWGDQAGRVHCVAGAQAANTGVSEQVLECPLWSGAPCAGHGIDALAVAPYFGGYLGDPATAATVSGWTLDQLFAELRTGGVLAGGPQGGALAQAKRWMLDSAAVADRNGVEMIAYEGGQHLVGYDGAENNDALTALFGAANRDARMQGTYRQYLDSWRASGGHTFVAFNFAGTYGKWGNWGALEYVTQPSTPKWTALTAWAQSNPCWWDGCR
ncbi:MAG TPA: hypothetical protein VGE07_30130 [Herpetosiphonaceae bacterium]